MMFAHDEGELREWILDGAPKRLREDEGYQQDQEKALIRMPAFRDRISEVDLENLVAYLKAVSWFSDPPSDLIIKGREAAYEKGCFGCHGPSGQGEYPIQDRLRVTFLVGMVKIIGNWYKTIGSWNNGLWMGLRKRFKSNRRLSFF